jgi:sulfur carrier protein
MINGESHHLPDGSTIADVVRQLGLQQRRIAVEVNLEIVARERYPAHTLTEGDHVEIVHFVGGG